MAYIGKSPDGTGVRSRFYYTQTSGGGTSVTGSSDDGTTLAFSDGAYVDVFLNGVLLVAGTDYNTTTANTIAGLAALANGDVVEVVVYDIFTVADTVSSLNGGAFSGAVTVPQLNADNLRLDGNTISTTSGDMTLDAVGDVIIDADGADIRLKHAGTEWGRLVDSTNNFLILNPIADKDIIFNGIDGSSEITALTLDMSAGGNAIFNGQVMTNTIGRSDDTNTTIDFPGSDVIQFYTSGSERMRIDSSGKVYIGRTSDPYMSTGSVKRLSVDGGTTSTDATFVSNKNSASTMYHFYFHNSNSVVGSISTNASATSFNTSSDHRLKENVSDMTGSIDRVKSLQPKRFNWITDPDDTTIDGFLAHECQTVIPEAINGTHNETRAATGIVKEAGGKVLAENVQQADWTANKGDDDEDLYPSDSTWTASENLPVYQTIDQSKIVPLLTGALKEAIAKIETLETKVAALEAGE